MNWPPPSSEVKNVKPGLKMRDLKPSIVSRVFNQQVLGMGANQMRIANSRATDPKTSHDAGASMKKAATAQGAAVLMALKMIGPCGAEEIADRIGLDPYAVRKRLPELQDAGLVAPISQTRKTRTGRAERIWVFVDTGLGL